MQGIDLSQFRGKPEESFQPEESPCLSDTYHSIIKHTIRQYGMGDDLSYDFAFSVIPGPQGPMPGYALSMRLPTLVIGEIAQTFGLIDGAGLTQDSLENVVKESIDALRDQRLRQQRLTQ